MLATTCGTRLTLSGGCCWVDRKPRLGWDIPCSVSSSMQVRTLSASATRTTTTWTVADRCATLNSALPSHRRQRGPGELFIVGTSSQKHDLQAHTRITSTLAPAHLACVPHATRTDTALCLLASDILLDTVLSGWCCRCVWHARWEATKGPGRK